MRSAALELDDPFADEPGYDHPESVEALRVMYERAVRGLDQVQGELLDASRELRNDADGLNLYNVTTRAWYEAHEMLVALNWLILDEVPIYRHTHRPKAGWVEHWFAGPWTAERP